MARIDSELESLRTRSRAVAAFCAERFESAADRAVVLEFQALVEELATGADLMGMETLYRELVHVAEHLSPADRLELNALLAERFDFDTEGQRDSDALRVAAILKRGVIRSPESVLRTIVSCCEVLSITERLSPKRKRRKRKWASAYWRSMRPPRLGVVR